jgi:hypothetical protein
MESGMSNMNRRKKSSKMTDEGGKHQNRRSRTPLLQDANLQGGGTYPSNSHQVLKKKFNPV